MQNTIVKEFAGDTGVVAVIFNQGGSYGETRAWLEVFWDNYFLRGGVLWDETGAVGAQYGQPSTGLPFGRGFIIDQDGRVALPYFGHDPALAIARIHELRGSAGAGVPPSSPASVLALRQPAPNPAPGRATIPFALASPCAVRLSVFDVLGRRVRALLDGALPAGEHRAHWDGRDAEGRAAPSGVYLVRLESGGQAASRRLLLLRP